MPAVLRAGIEQLSGFALDDVRVHYNSPRPAALQALAYTQGSEIHIGPGQERHLPHEAWHVVQQKQGRVRPTLQMKGAAISDDDRLEREADVMGERAASNHLPAQARKIPKKMSTFLVQRMEGKRSRRNSISLRVQSHNVSDLVKMYIEDNTPKVAFNLGMIGGWERWFQGEIFFLLAETLGHTCRWRIRV